MNKELHPLCPIWEVTKLCKFGKFARMCTAEWTKGFVRGRQKDIVGRKNTQIVSIGKVIDIGIVLMKRLPIVHITPPHRILCGNVCCLVGWDKYDDGLHRRICSKHIIDRLLFIPDHRIMHEKKDAHLALCMCTVMNFLQIVRRCFAIGKCICPHHILPSPA